MAAPLLVQDAGLAMATIIDTSVLNTTIVCVAQPGTLPSDPYWRIQKIVTAGAVQTITWGGVAGAYGKFDQVAANRLTTVTYG